VKLQCAVLGPAVFVSLLAVSHAQTVWYVDGSAPAGGDGSSWRTAFDAIDDALDAVEVFDQVWVRAGIYRPVVLSDPNDPRSATFWVPSGTALVGGFAGNETSPLQRPDGARSVLSGDLGLLGDASDNAYHVVTAYQWGGLPPRTVLDRFTIEDGNADGTALDSQGGALYLNNSVVLLSRCVLRRNNAVEGGAVYASLGELQTRWCTIEDNTATRGGALYGRYGTLNVFNTLVRNNTAATKGGAYFCHSTYLAADSARFVGCTFHDNTARNGGVAYVRGLNSTMGFPSHVAFFACTLAGNVALKTGGAIFEDTSTAFPPETRVVGSILWSNRAATEPEIEGNPQVAHCTVTGGYSGPGNLASDPEFVDEEGRDLRLSRSSPCVEAAVNAALPEDRVDLDADGNLSEPIPLDALGLERVSGSRVDMGAYELPIDGPATGAAARRSGTSIGTSSR
jgi:hypothetical protein